MGQSQNQSTSSSTTPVLRRIEIEKGYQLLSESSNYTVEKVLGEGSFGYVVKCLKSSTNEKVAVKVAKTNDIPQQEEFILRKLQAFDEYFIRLENSFIHREFYCHEFELLDMSLYQFMKNRSQLALPEIRKILYQAASALQILRNLEIIHGDLKPENIMMVDHAKQPLRIKLIDFGCSVQTSEAKQGRLIQTLWYRAPEVILACPFGNAIDMWSLGCLTAEMFLGFPLYRGDSEYDILWQITCSHGQIPQALLRKGWQTGTFYKQSLGNTLRLKSPEEYGIRLKRNSFDVNQFLMNPRYMSEQASKAQLCDMEAFVNLLTKMLTLDPSERIHPAQVLEHPFITMNHLMTSFCNSSYAQESAILMGASSDKNKMNKNTFEISPKRALQCRPKRSPWNISKRMKLTINAEKIKLTPMPKTYKYAPSTTVQLNPRESSNDVRNTFELSKKRKVSLTHTEDTEILSTSKDTSTTVFRDKTQGRSPRNMSEGSPKRKKVRWLTGDEINLTPVPNTCTDATVAHFFPQEKSRHIRNTLEIPHKRKRPSTKTEDKHYTQISSTSKSAVFQDKTQRGSCGNMSEGSPKRKKVRWLISDEEINLTPVPNTCTDATSTLVQFSPQERSSHIRNTLEISLKRKRPSTNTEDKHNTQISSTSKSAVFQDKTQRGSCGNMSEGSPERKRMRVTINAEEENLTALSNTCKGNRVRNTTELPPRRSSTNREYKYSKQKLSAPPSVAQHKRERSPVNISEGSPKRKRIRWTIGDRENNLTTMPNTCKDATSSVIQPNPQENSSWVRNILDFFSKRKTSSTNTEEKNNSQILRTSKNAPSTVSHNKTQRRSPRNMSEGSQKRKRISWTIDDEEKNLRATPDIEFISKEIANSVRKILEFFSKRKKSKNAPSTVPHDKTHRSSSPNVSEDSPKRKRMRVTTDAEEKNLTAMPISECVRNTPEFLKIRCPSDDMENKYYTPLSTPENDLTKTQKTSPQRNKTTVTTEAEEKGLTDRDRLINLLELKMRTSRSVSAINTTIDNKAKNVWIIGSSHVVRGKTAAYDMFGENFGLTAKVTWFGQEDMRWKDVLPCFSAEASKQNPPDILVVHAGCNDLGLMPFSDLGLLMRKNLVQLHEQFPSMKIVYSCMTDQNQWNGKPPRVIIERRSVNQRMIKVADWFGGEVIQHHHLKGYNDALFLSDGINFSKEGNEIFLTRIREVIEKILNKEEPKRF